ncbi:hypothetical protein LTR62_008389 [Meristemomyces frigidus]|uniref:Uncharacterized protein n=1 Tax=Meristemomyces frigidus TaxID=1508187 RepID=A0AAN7TDG6_9PEZI|nr:hypothetical protein LTR62_008389 [Meristemomyces frigidus]
MLSTSKQRLHWTQRVALVRHSLHSASRSNDFTFFKTLQVESLLEGTNHVATLSNALGDVADTLLASMDNLNASLAYVHQDAFKKVYDNLKESIRGDDREVDRSRLYVDITTQKSIADRAIDKMANSAISLTNQQPEHVQDLAVNVWITGATIVADSMEISLKQMDEIALKMDDFIRLEEGWNTVCASVSCAVTALKGVFSLMDTGSSSPASDKGASARSSSVASVSGAMFRRFSNAFAAGGSSTQSSEPASRNPSIASANLSNFNRNGSMSSLTGNPVYRTPNYMRGSVGNGCPSSMPAHNDYLGHTLSIIPPTPAFEEATDPFDISVPPMPEMPDVATIQPVTMSLHQRRASQMTT